jgi:endoglucanase
VRHPARLLTVAALLAALVAVPAPAHAAGPLGLTSGFYVNRTRRPPSGWQPSDGLAGRRDPERHRREADRPLVRQRAGCVGPAVGGYVGAADSHDLLPVLVAYNLPGRDACGGQSAGGAGSDAAYRTWISTFAAAVGTHPAVVVIEPDALGDFDCMTAAQIQARLDLLTYAVSMFTQKAPNAWAYLDGGNARNATGRGRRGRRRTVSAADPSG